MALALEAVARRSGSSRRRARIIASARGEEKKLKMAWIDSNDVIATPPC